MTVTVERDSAPTPEVETTHTGSMRIADHTGDTVVTWDRHNETEVAIARAGFDAARRKGHLAYRVGDGDRRESEVMRSFDPEAEHIVLMPATVGG